MNYKYSLVMGKVIIAFLLFIFLPFTPYPLILNPVVHAAPLTDESTLSLQKDNPQQSKDEGAGLFVPFVKLFAGLAVVVGVMLIVSHFAKQRLNKSGVLVGKGKLINVITTQYIAPKKAVMVIEVAGEYLLIGVGEEINLLAKIGDKGTVPDLPAPPLYPPLAKGGTKGGVSPAFTDYLETASSNEGATGIIESIKASVDRLKGKR